MDRSIHHQIVRGLRCWLCGSSGECVVNSRRRPLISCTAWPAPKTYLGCGAQYLAQNSALRCINLYSARVPKAMLAAFYGTAAAATAAIAALVSVLFTLFSMQIKFLFLVTNNGS